MKTIAPGVTGKAPIMSIGAIDIPFEQRDFSTAQCLQIFSCGKTTFFEEILPELEAEGGVYYEGNRLKVNGRAILARRERKLRERRTRRQTPRNRKLKKS